MHRLTVKTLLYFVGTLLFVGVPVAFAGDGEDTPAAATNFVVREGNDFATLELREPWDMDSFYDISQGINQAGSSNYITNIDFTDGVFSGVATGNYSEFYVLYPGYKEEMHLPGTGVVTPIDPYQYRCIHVAMKADIPETTTYYWNMGWVEDDTLSGGNGSWGKTYGNKVVNGQWTLYQMDIKNHPYIYGDPWFPGPDWQGLRITPIMSRPNTAFHVDWVRLTDCTPSNVTLTELSANQTYDIWLGHGSPERQILVADGVASDSNGNYQLDVQGIEPDTYTYYVKQGGAVVQQGTLTIEASPIPEFTNPSPFAGDEYSTLAGNPWDMSSANDIVAVYCAQWSVANGIFNIDTKTGSQLPVECQGNPVDKEADPRVYLNTPVHEDISSYRYLSFRHKINGGWQVPYRGMIVRWMWRVQHPTKPGKFCVYVGRSIALDVDWKTYWVDLHDAWNGDPIETSGSASGCPAGVDWKDQHNPILYFRIDPNENVTGSTFHQEFDWIKLTKVQEIYRGVPFPIQVSLNKDPGSLQSATFYYTNDLNNPTQNLVQVYNTNATNDAPASSSPDSLYQIFLPVVFYRYATPVVPPAVENEILVYWDTRAVTSGEYYLCLVSDDGYNQTTMCSDAPLKIIP